ncbi:hypothetical protein ACTXT7_011874, partial [Hymenolepis weldensis]
HLPRIEVWNSALSTIIKGFHTSSVRQFRNIQGCVILYCLIIIDPALFDLGAATNHNAWTSNHSIQGFSMK